MKYFDYCARVLSEEGYLFQHYNPDGSLASNWHSWLVAGKEVLPIQEDSTALTLWALWIHYQSLKDIEFIRPLYNTLIKKAADFLVSYRDPQTLLPLPSYDLVGRAVRIACLYRCIGDRRSQSRCEVCDTLSGYLPG